MLPAMTAPDVTLASALNAPFPVLAEAMARGFEGYFVPIPSDPGVFAARVRQEQIDLASSLVALGAAGEAVGLALVARRGTTDRVAAMGVALPWRGRGVGDALLRRLALDARARGARRLLLEVVEQNAPAVALYGKHGFAVTRRLVGHEGALPPGDAADLHEWDVEAFADLAARDGDPALPWQLHVATLGALTPPSCALRLGPAAALVNTAGEAVVVRGLVVERARRREGHGTRLLRALAARFEGRRLAVPAVVPEGPQDAFLRAAGLERSALSQFEMVRDLAREA